MDGVLPSIEDEHFGGLSPESCVVRQGKDEVRYQAVGSHLRVKSSRAKPGQAESSRVESSLFKPSQAKWGQGSEAKASRVKAKHAKLSQET